MRRRTRQRLTSCVIVFCLLFQQVAVAAFACEKLARPPPTPASMAHCAEMEMTPAAAQSPALCEKHCVPDLPVPTDTQSPGVPALALPPVAHALVFAAVPQAKLRTEVPISRSDPPPRLRYCSLLI